jgi:hypothetical protein
VGDGWQWMTMDGQSEQMMCSVGVSEFLIIEYRSTSYEFNVQITGSSLNVQDLMLGCLNKISVPLGVTTGGLFDTCIVSVSFVHFLHLTISIAISHQLYTNPHESTE